jgi:hypothetical protein
MTRALALAAGLVLMDHPVWADDESGAKVETTPDRP